MYRYPLDLSNQKLPFPGCAKNFSKFHRKSEVSLKQLANFLQLDEYDNQFRNFELDISKYISIRCVNECLHIQ